MIGFAEKSRSAGHDNHRRHFLSLRGDGVPVTTPTRRAIANFFLFRTQ
ncbi:hypothetical protein [Mycobacterium leprae]|nr:hypothetical protein [Mycobacterium leprae]